MSGDIVIVQHGQKVPEPGDPGLTPRGHRQAVAVASVIARSTPASVHSSPLLRARLTAAPLAALVGMTVTVDQRLRERTNLEAGMDQAAFFADWARATEDRAWARPGSRSSEATACEMLAALDEVVVEGRLVAVFSHGGATLDLLRTLLGDDELERRCPGLIARSMPAGSLTRLRGTGRGWEVLAVGEVGHLEPEGDPADGPRCEPARNDARPRRHEEA